MGASTTFRSEDVRFLEAIGGQLAIAIARAELFSKVSRLAYQDTLTGLANRRGLEERLQRALDRFGERRSAVALLLCDVDRLKVVNDRHGHARGDRALRQVAAALVAASADHPGAFVARLAGDEFCVVLESSEQVADDGELEAIAQLGTSAQRLLAAEEDRPSLSCGAATAGSGTSTAAELLRAADTAQYVAKRRGGNRVCTAAQIADAPDRLAAPERDRRSRIERITEAAATVADGLAARADAPILERLEYVATTLTETADLARWAVSIAASGTDYLSDVALGDNRERGGVGIRVAKGFETYELYKLDEFPATRRIVAAGTGSFIASAADATTDEAERLLLEREGLQGVVAAVVGNEDGVYLVELVSDEIGAPLEAVEPLLALAVQAAIPPTPLRRSTTSTDRGERALALSLALADRLAGTTAVHEVCEAAVEEVQEAFGCTIVHLVAAVGDQLELRAERGPVATSPGWNQKLEAGLMGRSLRERAPVLAYDVKREPQFRSTAANREVRSELAVPVLVAGKSWGVLNLEDTEIGTFKPEDARLLESVAAQIGVSLTAIGLYERLERAYVGTAEALSAALEATDAYSAQHSRSIVEHAAAVGSRLGVGGEELRMLRYGAAFHDIGKVAIPREVLNKSGPLSADEWMLMAQHTIIGERILVPIEFLAPIQPIVRYAHERWDGNGYPEGLAGSRIPLGARIIFACDAYDAMTTDRTYRAAMPAAMAREQLRQGAGSQFDPTVVAALLEVLEA